MRSISFDSVQPLRGCANWDALVYPEFHSGLLKFNPVGIVYAKKFTEMTMPTLGRTALTTPPIFNF